MEYKKIYNDLYSVLVVNLFTLNKENKIKINFFNPKNKRHLIILHGLVTLNPFIKNNKHYINCNFINFLKIKFKFRKALNLKWISHKKTVIDADTILTDISNPNNQPYEIWEEIYDCFFGKEK